ncbi:MAG: DUF6513 domain-containing protein, partial [Candidatus Acidiferrum sp.]
LFVTGKLAEPSLRRILAELPPRAKVEYHVAVLPISVIALATTEWIARHIAVPDSTRRIIVPGLCQGQLTAIEEQFKIPVERGPADLLDLQDFFQEAKTHQSRYGAYDIEILAEINHAPRLSRTELLHQARHFRESGADIIDVGCDPGSSWNAVGEAVRALRDEGMRVSIDSFDPREVESAVSGGAELVLSVNSGNIDSARSWGREVVVLPDELATLGGLDQSVEKLTAWGVPFRIDPVIEPISLGFAASLGRYLEMRRRYPAAQMLMGVANLTELTDVDSAGVNTLLLGFCQELGIRSVLTTEVINWCRDSVRELDIARRLVYFACTERVLPKNLEPRLVMLRDARLREFGSRDLHDMAMRITDKNFRIFAERGLLHIFNAKLRLEGNDPFELFDKMAAEEEISPSHAFYLGYEMAKAVTAITLGKNYVQDQALNWGMLTIPETNHRGKISPSIEPTTPNRRDKPHNDA